MAMGVGTARGGVAADINVTPMIDVLLVLLVIFVVVQQGLQRGIDLQVPPPPDGSVTDPNPEQIVLEVLPGGAYRINRQPVGPEGVRAAVARIFSNRPRKVLFVKGAEGLAWGQVVHAADEVRAAGVLVVGLVPRAADRP